MEHFTKDRIIEINSLESMRMLFGNFDENIELIEEETGVNIITRGTNLIITGNSQQVDLAYTVISKLLDMIERKESIDRAQIRYAIQLATEGKEDLIEDIAADIICITHKGKPVRCKSLGQKHMSEQLHKMILFLP